jgi:L-ascorbate metabolism protein UlaG (beta-lactamase superfamily)
MELVKFTHACVRLETPEGVLVVDPGNMSGPDTLTDADVVFITHMHPDHLDAEPLRALAAAKPRLTIYGPPSLAGELGDTPFTAVRHGDTIQALGIVATVHGEWHELIHPAFPPVENVGYFIDAVSPTIVHPIHEATLSEAGQAIADRVLSAVTKPEYARLAPGDRLTL